MVGLSIDNLGNVIDRQHGFQITYCRSTTLTSLSIDNLVNVVDRQPSILTVAFRPTTFQVLSIDNLFIQNPFCKLFCLLPTLRWLSFENVIFVFLGREVMDTRIVGTATEIGRESESSSESDDSVKDSNESGKASLPGGAKLAEVRNLSRSFQRGNIC